MKKEKCRLFLFVFVFFTFLFNLDGVKAAENCSCYYYGRLTTDDGENSYYTDYLVQLDFNKTEYERANPFYSPKIVFFGEKGYNTVTGQSGKVEDKTAEAEWLGPQFGVAFSNEVTYQDLYNTVAGVFNTCSVESCGNIRTKRYIGPIETADTGGLKFYSRNNSKN